MADSSSNSNTQSGDEQQQHLRCLSLALSEARKSPPKPTNYCVGAVLVDPSLPSSPSQVIATGYTLELPGNTHAEQCCLLKLCSQYSCAEEDLPFHLPDSLVLYTTMEPCSHRLSGNLPCAERIAKIGREKIKTVVVGVAEPETFVKENTGRKRLMDVGIEFVHVEGLAREIIEVATVGHEKKGDERAL
ncbi:Bifunctional protein RIB2 [Zalerion maritima]|uniref:Bifunctional protein RIB2 n=1 Tax=Zalerion maritima TaxID=339359 RepID=A0AAD5WQ24_9PEZI|nr:Bifunctional protein RIB2 [Zalerion maritima]